MRRRLSLSGQFLALQLAIVLLVVIAVAGVSLAQSNASFHDSESDRVLSVAETVATRPGVRAGLADDRRSGVLPPIAESARAYSGIDYVIITNRARQVLTSSYPDLLGQALPTGNDDAVSGRGWVGLTERDGREVVEARVPVLSTSTRVGAVLGVIAVGSESPSLGEQFLYAVPNLLTYLALAGSLGIIGSFLLSRRIKRQTLGLEPDEITGLVENREAMLHGLREGVVGLDGSDRVTVLNDEALRLLGLTGDAVGEPVADLGLDEALTAELTGAAPGAERVVVLHSRALVLNRMPVEVRGRGVGSVTTFRDRTELLNLRRELDATRSTTDALRAQGHEFRNRMHTISGLVELGDYDAVAHYVASASGASESLTLQVTRQIDDPALSALLVAKASRAAELGVAFELTETTELRAVDDELSADLVTVVGNLVDNAFDAMGQSWGGASQGGSVQIDVHEEGSTVVVEVRDTGPGVAAEFTERVFAKGFSTKGEAHDIRRGWGLALTRLVVQRRGGQVSLANDNGAVFRATLPDSARVPAPEGEN